MSLRAMHISLIDFSIFILLKAAKGVGVLRIIQKNSKYRKGGGCV